jgi:signal transduction histidine kinase
MSKQKLILLIDDQPVNHEILKMQLEEEEYEILSALNGEEGFAMAKRHQPLVICCDLLMPNLAGDDVCRLLKADPQTAAIPILMMTSQEMDTALLVRCLSAGAEEFVSQPLRPLELSARIRSLSRISLQYRRLQETLELRERFSHMLVHDMRNHLTVIRAGTFLLEHSGLEQKQQRCVQDIYGGSQALEQMLDEMLTIAATEDEHLRLNRESCLVSELIRDATQYLSSMLELKRVRIHIEGVDTAETTTLFVDRRLFLRVIENLVNNALQYTPRDSVITIRFILLTERMRLEVCDQGAGVDPAWRERIFDAYQTGEVPDGRPYVRIGLGLAFCRTVVNEHGGHIGVEANTPKGSIFFVEMPR